MKKLINLSLLLFTIHFLFVCISAQTEQKAELVVQTGHSNFANVVGFSLDGKILASGGSENDKTIKLWDVESGKELRTLRGHKSSINSIAFSPNDKILASAGGDWTVKLWNIENGKEIRSFAVDSLGVAIMFSPDGKTLTTALPFRDAIKLWDVATGKHLRTITWQKSSDQTNNEIFSPDGKILAASVVNSTEKTKIKLWSAVSGKELRTIEGRFSYVQSIAFNPDGKTLASGNYLDRTITLWDVATGNELKTFKHSNTVKLVAFTPDGKTLAGVEEKFQYPGYVATIRLWNVESGKELKTFANNPNIVSIIFSPDGKTLASGNLDWTVKVWDVVSGEELRNFTGHSKNIESVAFSLDGKILASQSSDCKIKLWDIETGKLLRTLENYCDSFASFVFSPDGKIIASVGTNTFVVFRQINLWDVKSGKKLRTLKGHNDYIYSLRFSPDSKTLVSGSSDIKLWDVASGKELKTIAERGQAIAYSPDGKVLANAQDKGVIKLRDVESGKELQTFTGGAQCIGSIAFSIDGKRIIGACSNVIEIWDVITGKELESFLKVIPAKKEMILRLFPSFYEEYFGEALSEKYIAKLTESIKIKLSVRKTEKELAILVPLDDNDWAVINPTGLFDASPGARKLMHYVIGLEPISLEQMKDVYYIPNLLQKIFKGEPLPKVELFSKKDLFPDVEFSQPKAGQKDLTVKLTNRGGGIGQVQILVNGKEFVKDARPANFDINTKETTLTVSLKDAPLIAGKENKIEVVARNAAGSLTTRGTARGTQIIDLSGDKTPTETPHIYAIVGGISNYTGDNLKLNYAAKDAEDFARALELGAIKLLNGDKSKVHVRLLTSSGDKSNVKFNAPDAKISTATKADFERAFADFRNATPNDVFIVYLAGHGVSLNLNQNPNQAGGDTYLYLTQEATTTDKSVLAVENSRKAMTVSSEELKDLMKQNKALKQVLILDTCASGQAAESFVQKRDLPSDQIRAIERLKDNTGFYVLMGSAADSVSYEASQYGQGLLTYSLLQGMKGARLRENQFADVGLLFDYAQEEVPKMAKNIGGIQQPRIITPDVSRSFDIGKFTQDEQKLISLSTLKPIFTTPTLFNPAANRDNLKLSKMMAEQLRTLSYVSARGANSPIVFVEADEMPDAFQPSGSYTIEGDTLKISVILVKNNAPVGKEITVTGKASEPEKVIKHLIEVVMNVLK